MLLQLQEAQAVVLRERGDDSTWNYFCVFARCNNRRDTAFGLFAFAIRRDLGRCCADFADSTVDFEPLRTKVRVSPKVIRAG